MFDDIPDQVKELIEARVYRNLPLKELAKKFKISIREASGLLKEYDRYVSHIVEERRLSAKGKYLKLDKLAMTTIKDILKTEHMVDVFQETKDGPIAIGKKLDANVLKLKKEVAEKILENTGAKDKEIKGGGINIDNRSVNGVKGTNAPKNDKEIIADQRKNEVAGILDDCKSLPIDAKSIIDVEVVSEK